jgi:type III pantothenate kinase
MNLIIDIGNSGTKLALFSEKRKITSGRVEHLYAESLDKFCSNYPVGKIIISSVTDIPEFLSGFAEKRSVLLHLLSYRSKLPFSISYLTPETLGTDRIAAVAGAYDLYKGSEILVIDAGTAITYDILTGDKYEGGNISPGIDMRFRALNTFTGRLPMASRSNSFTSPGINTTDAIVAGVITGVVYEINEYIRTFEEKHKDSKVILTGGDGLYLKDRISGGCTYLPDIVTDGLNYILDYNAK